MKITEMIISGLLKKGILYEARNCNLDFEVPFIMEGDLGEPHEEKVKINVKIDHMTLRVEKDEK